MSESPSLIATFKDTERLKLLRKCQRDLWFLATEIMDYTLLTKDFHKPIMDEMDLRRRLRARGRYMKDELELWPRDHYKTTVQKARCIQDFLNDPTDTITWWHAVAEMASEVGMAVGNQFLKNKTLRRVMPEIMPSVNSKRFATAAGFRLKSADPDGAPSFRTWGAGSEATGGHSKRGYLDDIIGLGTIEDNLMPKVRRWVGSTVRNVVRTGCPVFATGTRWDSHDIYSDWIKSKYWDVRIRGCFEVEGVPDWNGEPVLYTKKEIAKKRAGMTEYEFGCQMMNDPIPASERLWQDECEQYITLKAAAGPGPVFVLSDPAPAKTGSFDGRNERDRADGSKDEWAICVVKLMRKGDILDIILLDGAASKAWTKDQGFEQMCRLAKKWHTQYLANEATGQAIALYEPDIREAARRVGVSVVPLKLQHTYKGKNAYFESLTSKGLRHEVHFCETVPQEFLDGLLEQLRGWRALASGRNGLRFDDRANCFSFATDPELRRYAPTPDISFDPWEVMEDQAPRQVSRYCGY